MIKSFTCLYSLKIFYLCISLLLTSLPLLVISQSLASQRQILLNIKKLWGNQPPTQAWDSTSSPCRWPGIQCSGDETVIGIHVAKHSIAGKIPPIICDLKNLTTLDLCCNNFQGEFPTFLYNCSNLQKLDLSNNLLVGQLPNDIQRLSSRLQHLDLSFNSFTGDIHSLIRQLGGLLYLNLRFNSFSGKIPISIGQLQGLTYLDLSTNRFSGNIPSSIGQLRGLLYLKLRFNSFSGNIPSSIGQLRELTYLDLSNNRFSGNIPSSIGQLRRLLYLKLRFNSFSGNIPSSIGQLRGLTFLDLSNIRFSGNIPSSIGQLQGLTYLDLSFNSFSGNIPRSIGQLQWLTTLNLESNDLIGEIPVSLAKMSSLEVLRLAQNNLVGEIPREIFLLRNLSSSDFQGNPNLCSDIKTFGIPRCTYAFGQVSTFSFNRYLAAIILLPVAIAMMILYLLFSKVIIPRQRKRRQHNVEQPSWTMTTFHNLSFTKTDILCGLIETNVIGSGGSGKIYSVDITNSGGKVAVKRIWNDTELNSALEKQFKAEVEILGRIRHVNMVKLLCCVSKVDSMLLVYEYMENQSLDKWLRPKNKTHHESSDVRSAVLDWPTRLRIAIGAAKGLSYMHHDCSPPIIHRDVKTSNVLLDCEFNAKIADFGLAKMLAYEAGDPRTASVVAGSFSYIAPEYWQTQRLNEKIDIYSFGVVLLELATGKEPCKGNNYLNLADWSWKHYCEGQPIADALDNNIKEPCFLDEMIKVFTIGLMCTSKVPSSRPSMKQVQQMLTDCSHCEASTDSLSQEDGVTPFLSDNST